MSDQNLSPKINLCYYSTFKELSEINHNPSYKLLTDYSELLSILNSNKKETIKFLYFNKSNINNILYNSEEIITIQNNENMRLSEFFYLYLLINDNSELVNYAYDINYIYEINNIQRNIQNNKIFKKLILSKIVIQLIENYRESNEYKLYEENELEIIEEENKLIILRGINEGKLNKYNLLKLESIEKRNVEEVYLTILIQLIMTNRYDLYEFIHKDLIEELDLESINITKKMYYILYKITEDENIKNKFVLLTKDDLLNSDKMNFFVFVLKFIFKNPFYIYQIPLLLNARKNIINMIKNNFNQLSIFIKDQDKEKIEYIIKTLTDSGYYYNKYLNFNSKPLLEVLNYYKNYFPQSKKEEINIIESMIKNNKITGEINYLKDFDISKKMNIKFPIIKYILYLKIKYENFKPTEEDLNKSIQIWDKLENIIKKKKIKKIIKTFRIALTNYFNDINNKELLLQIFKQDDLNFFIKTNIKLLEKDKYVNDLEDLNNIYITKISNDINEN